MFKGKGRALLLKKMASESLIIRQLESSFAADEKAVFDRAVTSDSPLLAELKRKQAELAKDGQEKSLFAIFASMCRIQSGGDIVPFNLYDYQEALVDAIDANSRTVILKSRQLGVSETVCCYLLFRSVTQPGFSAVVFSQTGNDASKLARRIRLMALSLGSLCPEIASDNLMFLEFKGLGGIHFQAPTARGGRSIPSVSVLFFDEAAHIADIEALYQAASPTLAMVGDKAKVIVNSTPAGRQGWYYRLLVGGVGELAKITNTVNELKSAKADKHYAVWSNKKWAKVLLHWKANPVYGSDPDWATKKREEDELTEAQWNQEYELDFAEAEHNVFATEIIEKSAIGYFAPPQSGARYFAGLDPSFGGDDNFFLSIWQHCGDFFTLVHELAMSRKGKDYYLEKTIEALDLYRPEVLTIETNGGGTLYMQEISSKRSSLRIEPICTNNANKIVNTDRLALYMERGQIHYPPESILANELPHFVESFKGSSKTRNAESGFHDDSIMSSAIALSNAELAETFTSYFA